MFYKRIQLFMYAKDNYLEEGKGQKYFRSKIKQCEI